MTKAMGIIAAALTLTACGNSTKESAAVTGTVSLHNASQAQVSEQVAAAQGSGAAFDPGRWEGTVKMLDMAMPGMDKLPPAMAAQLKQKMNAGSSFASCLTPEQAADARKALSQHQNGDCTYDHFTMAGGRIDAAMTCKGVGGTMSMKMTGSYSHADYHIVSETSGGGGSPHGPMSVKMDLSAHHVGACTGTEDKMPAGTR